MEITDERQLNWTNDRGPSPLSFTDELDSTECEPLEGSGFEDETPESIFEEEQ